jgi:predicted phosphoribosyltransferase
VPGQEELAMGAIASGGVRVLNEDLVDRLGIPQSVIEAVTAREAGELERREQRFRSGRQPLELHGKTVILVDDGLATGATMLSAVKAVRARGAERVIVAVPIASAQACRTMQRAAAECLCLLTPADFFAVGQAYDDFSQTLDDEVSALLDAAHARAVERQAASREPSGESPHPKWR